MALQALAVRGYRSLRDLVVPVRALNVVTGANGTGKSSLYRSLRLLADTARGRLIGSLAREGGLSSTLWAGPQQPSRAMRRGEQPVQGTVRSAPVSLQLGFADESFGYAIDIGLPLPSGSAFARDPRIVQEHLWSGPLARPAALLVQRRNAVVSTRDERGDWQLVTDRVPATDSLLAHFADPRSAPELAWLRDTLRAWRFYDHFRTDSEAPARAVNLGTHTPVLAADGADLAAALQTIREIGDGEALDQALADAFEGARCEVRVRDGRFEVLLAQPGLLRPLAAAELSDGTLRYLLWCAALLSPRPPPLLVVNEPETSLHPDLLPALARLLARAAASTQLVVVTHSSRLVAALEDQPACWSLVLDKALGETRVSNLALQDRPAWHWPAR